MRTEPNSKRHWSCRSDNREIAEGSGLVVQEMGARARVKLADQNICKIRVSASRRTKFQFDETPNYPAGGLRRAVKERREIDQDTIFFMRPTERQ